MISITIDQLKELFNQEYSRVAGHVDAARKRSDCRFIDYYTAQQIELINFVGLLENLTGVIIFEDEE